MLSLTNVTKRFGDVVALDELSMTVPKGAVYGLVGPNGAGNPPPFAISPAYTARTAAVLLWRGRRFLRIPA